MAQLNVGDHVLSGLEGWNAWREEAAVKAAGNGGNWEGEDVAEAGAEDIEAACAAEGEGSCLLDAGGVAGSATGTEPRDGIEGRTGPTGECGDDEGAGEAPAGVGGGGAVTASRGLTTTTRHN